MSESTQITVKKEWVEKAREQAYQMRKPYYMLALSFGDERDYFLVEPDVLIELYEKAKAYDSLNDLYYLIEK